MKRFIRYFNIVAITAAFVLVAVLLILAPWRQSQPEGESLASVTGRGDARVEAFRTGPKPDFVIPVAAPEQSTDAGDGVFRFRLTDQQIYADGPRSAIYTRVVADVTSLSIAQALASQRIDFYPDHQTVVLHSVAVTRDGVTEERVDRTTVVEVVRDEALAASGILTGASAVLMRLPELRSGDTIDLSWTVVGSNPGLGGHAATLAPARFPVAIDSLSLGSKPNQPIDGHLQIMIPMV